jgi:hypothetical protein
MTRPPAFAKAFRGRWRIVGMEVWPDDYLDLIEPAHIPSKEARTASLCSVRSKAG